MEEILKCVLSGDLETLQGLFEREDIKEETQKEGLFGGKDEVGRNSLMVASMLGKTAIVRELLRLGAQVNEQTEGGGYSSLHLAACWSHLDTVRALLDLGADTQTKTFRGERPVDVARRYSNTACADCLILAEAQQDVVSYVAFVKDIASDPERNLTKEERKICKAACSAKSEWIQSVVNPTVSDFSAQRKDMEETLKPILSKLSAECE
ncbi:ankyrin repeat domain-containing protein 45 isoform X2 [Notolabrus celidotus]|uniref:ankyrin repeat domain-containing protein 45 isoform X2 n=1 Tax=Notolabrus celidotus TaxID=1203425 RepID=UPI001490098C|nr:ankyrin repeat domain-containing protein 45 isoform X2 [Notolabrus celidotus]